MSERTVEDALVPGKFTNKFSSYMLDAIDYVQRNNPGRINPYHNTDHMFHVARLALLIYSRESKNGCLGSQLALFVAAMFHDYNHSAGILSDDENIEAAVKAATWYLHVSNLKDLIPTVEAAIRCTRYPYIKEPESLIEKCLRDADVLYPAAMRDADLVMVALKNEMNVSRELRNEKPLDKAEVFEMQKNFNPVIFTHCGQEWWSVFKPQYLQLIEQNYFQEA